MKTEKKLIILFLLMGTLIGCKTSKDPDSYLREVLSNLEKIESATYHTENESWQHGDTTAMAIYCKFIKEYDNPADSTIGASYVSLDCDDTTQMNFCYDGKMRVLVYHEDKELVIDDFTVNPMPFRPLSPPFFNFTKNIIRYALETEDNITTELQDLGDHYYFKLVIDEDKKVEFFGKAHYMPEPPIYLGDPISIYELWISKSDNLPYKVRREMTHDISVTICQNPKFNELSIADFQASDYFPQDYEIKKYRMRGDTRPEIDFIGKKAPDWILNNAYEQPVALGEIKSKVLLINFTGIGCGPCQVSVPFLKELKDSFTTDDFELFAIECWARKAHSHQNYMKKNDLNYMFLSATDEVIKDYQTGGAVPMFFILDEQRIIRKIVRGYRSAETTGKEIMDAVKELL